MMEDKSTATLVEQRISACRGSQYRIPMGESDTSLEELRGYSRAILGCIACGNNTAGENELLREIYWYTVKRLAWRTVSDLH
ncbi:hypothetical protein ACFL6S_25905 [Candidatus Poribacteria bacterium]